MASFPLVERELRVALRKADLFSKRFKLSCWAVGITAVLIVCAVLSSNSRFGRFLHFGLLCYGLGTVLQSMHDGSSAVAEERRNRTLGILFLSGMGPLDIFIGKLLSSLLRALNELLVIVPLLALPFLMGGVSFQLFAATVCCLPVLLLFVVALSLFASCLVEDEGTALTTTSVIGTLICGLPPAIWMAQHWFAGTTALPTWLAISPGYAVYLVFKNFAGASPRIFWLSWEFTLIWSLGLLLASAIALRQLWRKETRQGMKGVAWRDRWLCWLRGDARWRKRIVARWLDRNPACWLEMRNRRPLVLAWAWIAGIGCLWVIGWLIWPACWLSVINFYTTALVLSTIMGMLQNHAIARTMATVRREGGSELLLTSALSVGDLVNGWFEGRSRQFRSVLIFLLAMEYAMANAGLFLRQWTTPALVDYFIIWGAVGLWTLNSCGFGASSAGVAWVALNTGRTSLFAVGQSRWRWRFWFFYALWVGRNAFNGLGGFPTGSTGEIVFCASITAVGLTVVLATRFGTSEMKEKLIKEFREIVIEPIPDPDDPRYAKWKQPHRERFPWGARAQ